MATVDVVFILGGPGAGKGTQCARVVDNFGFVHLSAGDLLRAERARGGSTAGLIEGYIKDGKIVPVEITIGLLKTAMEAETAKGNKRFLIDGFPRNQNNLEGWSKMMTNYATVHFVLYLDCPEEVMQKRLLSRKQGRSDDNLASIKKRFQTYQSETKPIIDVFNLLGKVRQIKADRTPDEVYQDVEKVFANVFGAPAASAKAVDAAASIFGGATQAGALLDDDGQEIPPDDTADVKRDFSVCLADLMREMMAEAEAAEQMDGVEQKSGQKKVQFWDLSDESQVELIKQAVKVAVFNPEATEGVTVEWKVEKNGVMSLSGGYTVTVHEKRADKNTTHSCGVNSFGVLEWWETPLHPQKRHLIPPQPPENAGCVLM